MCEDRDHLPSAVGKSRTVPFAFNIRPDPSILTHLNSDNHTGMFEHHVHVPLLLTLTASSTTTQRRLAMGDGVFNEGEVDYHPWLDTDIK